MGKSGVGEGLRKHSYRLDNVIKAFSLHTGNGFNRLLDIGCSDGGISMTLKKTLNIKEVYGIDINEGYLRMARKRGVKAFQLDIDKEDFPFEDNYFDAIFAGEVIEHLYDPDHFLDEVYRTLKGVGLCVITTPNLAAWYNRIVLIFGFQPFWTDASLRYPNIGKMRKIGTAKGEHIRVFTYRALIELLKLYNFKVEKVMGSCHLNPEELFPFPLNFIEKIMCHFKASSDLIVLFKKPQNTNLEHEKLRKEKFK